MAAHPVSPLAPKSHPTLPAVAGARFATGHSGIRYKNRDDLLLIEETRPMALRVLQQIAAMRGELDGLFTEVRP